MDLLIQTLTENKFFSILLSIVFIMGSLEIILTLIGFGLSSVLDNLIPDFDMDIEADIETDNSTFATIFSWLNKGRVPLLMIFLSFLTFFGLSGIIIQFILKSNFGFYIPSYLIIPIAFFISLPIVRYISVILAKIIPRDETSAVSRKLFVGNLATITLGKATYENPAEAKFKDDFGKTHYIMVKPTNETDIFSEGETVFIIGQENNSTFLVVKDPNKV